MTSMPPARRVPPATVARLPLYLRVLSEAAEEGTRTMSSELLAERAGVNAPQVRRDLSHLGSYGTRGVGYDVAFLMHQVNRQLGLVEERRVAIIGAGNLGRALIAYQGFPARGFRMVAAFDADPDKVGLPIGDRTVLPISSFADAAARLGIDVVVITTPAAVAQQVVDLVVAAGVGSLLNFAPTSVRVPAGVSLRQVDLGIELQILSFYDRRQQSAASEAG
jgi:redox-sensing transcriptional repressor